MSQIDRYHMMIVSKYFNYCTDFVDMMQICKKYQDIPAMFHYNPVPLTEKGLKLFPNIQTQYIYCLSEKVFAGIENYYYFGTISYSEYNDILKKGLPKVGFRMIEIKEKQLENKKVLPKGVKVVFTKPEYNYFYYYRQEKSIFKDEFKELNFNNIMILKENTLCNYQHLTRLELDNIRILEPRCINNLPNLQELNLKSLRYIGSNCVCYCSELTSITLPQTFFEEGKNCFQGLYKLQHIVSHGIKRIKTSLPFSDAEIYLKNGIDIKDIFYISNNLNEPIPCGVKRLFENCYTNKEVNQIILPTSVTHLSEKSFCNVKGLKEIDLRYVKKIKDQTFYECNDLTSVTILNKNCFCCTMFRRCRNMKQIVFIEDPPTIIENIIDDEIALILEQQGIQCDNVRAIPIPNKQLRDKITYIENENGDGNGVWNENGNGVWNETTLHLPSNLIEIGKRAFSTCPNLKTLNFPSKLRTIQDICFSHLPLLVDLDLNEIHRIGQHCFLNINSLTALTISTNLDVIPSSIQQCSSLLRIKINGKKLKALVSRTFANKIKEMNDCELENIYLTKEESKKMTTIPNDVNILDYDCFRRRNDLKSIVIPSNITRIENNCFQQCEYLTKVQIHQNVQSIGDFCFSDCCLLEIVDTEIKLSFGRGRFYNTKFIKTLDDV